jgi:hypothetical protein
MALDASPHGRRVELRLDKAFPVIVHTEVDGACAAIARNISAGGMFVEMRDPPPIGVVVTVTFESPEGGSIRARAQVKHHVCWNFQTAGDEPAAARGIGLRFLEILDGEEPADLRRDHAVH